MYVKELMMYGIGGAADNYRVLRYTRMKASDYSVREEKTMIEDMMEINPGIRRIFIVDNTGRLHYYFNDAFKRNTMEDWACFKDILERWGRECIIPKELLA